MPNSCDVLIIGGGATGCGVALDLALRGLQVVLVDKGDLADGTSGRYHGLLHSGGRYAVGDPDSARECIDENRILRHIAPSAVEDTGGLFVLTAGDDPAYADRWLHACHSSGIPAVEIAMAEALQREPALDPQILRAFSVPDGSVDSFDLLELLRKSIVAHRGRVLVYHEVTALTVEAGVVTSATLKNVRSGDTLNLSTRMIVNAAGPWAGKVAALAGCHVGMRLSKGTMVAMAYRLVNSVINRCHQPGDGDILVPIGTVAVIGTTSVPVSDPGESRAERWEIRKLLAEGEKLVPGFAQARALRVWAGVRPLYEEGSSSEGRNVKRTFAVLDHAQLNGVGGLVTVVGGKLTTYRLMAERTADLVAAQLGNSTLCATKDYVLPNDEEGGHTYHRLGSRLQRIEQATSQDRLLCECELITRQQLAHAAAVHPEPHAPWVLDDLRRDLRLGMGPCQGGFCGYRAAGILHEGGQVSAEQAVSALTDFAQRRWRGQRQLLWGQALRQALLDEQLYRGTLGLPAQEVHGG
jgi:glycerol-3-phosphate dehydrogenase